jgi:ferredoxin-nitrite reductase
MESNKLNKIEKLKRRLKPIDYFEKLAAVDPEKLDESDRFYLKNFGIYNHKLAPGTFTLRIRVAGGRIAFSAFETVVALARSVRARVVLTSRAQIELHGLDYASALSFSRQIEEAGLTGWQTYIDNFRNIVTDPLDGLGEDSVIEVYDTILQMQNLFLKTPMYVGTLPRKFNTAISGSRVQHTSFFGNDLYFALAKKEDRFGFNLYAGGKNSKVARSLDIFVSKEDVAELFRIVAEIYMEEGPRESRSKARLFHLIERIGVDVLRRKIEEKFSAELVCAGELLAAKFVPREKFPLKNGRWAHCYATRFGEIGDEQIDEILECCRRYGIETLRLGCDQNIYLPGLPEEVGFSYASDRYVGILACTGSKYCVYAMTDTKAQSGKLSLDKCRASGIGIGFSGCLKGCARHAFCDIGLVGIRTKLFSDRVERGIRLYLGAEYTEGRRTGRLILYSVPMRHLDAMIALIADLFAASGYGEFEAFAADVLNRYSEPALAFWLLLNYYRRHVAHANELFLLENRVFEDEKGALSEQLEGRGESDEIVGLLRREEAFPFREAIIYLERACFKVKSQT